jgi:hypothetical protein
MPYDDLVKAFDSGDVLFGLSDDLNIAEAALKEAYGSGATFWNRFTKTGQRKNAKAERFKKKTDVLVQAGLTNAVADPGKLGDEIKAAIPAVRGARAPGGTPLQQAPMKSAYEPGRVPTKLPSESQRGVDFAAFLAGHEKYDPKLMGGAMASDGSYQPLGSKETDRQWIAASRRTAFENHLTDLLDAGGPTAVLKLKGGQTKAAKPTGQNRAFIKQHWDQIDWAQYDMWGWLHESHLSNVINYKVWKRTSKAGLEFQTTVRRRTVHFLLDTFLKGGGMNSAVTKGGAHGRSITAGELRWLYRNWSNPHVSANTHFWTVTGAQKAPWVAGPHVDLWKTYVPKGKMNRDNSRALAAALMVHDEPSTSDDSSL